MALRGGVDAGGQNVYVDEVSRNLGALGYSVDVFSRRDTHDLAEVVDWAPGVRLVHLPAGPLRPMLKDELWPHMPEFRDAVVRFGQREGMGYDLIHGNFWMSGWVALETRLQPGWAGIPLVQIFHAMGKTKRRHQGDADTSPHERIEVELEIVKGADRLIAQCPSEESELVDDYDADPAKVCVIPSAVNPCVFQPVGRDQARQHIGLAGDGPVVVYVGRMLPRKDVRNVVRAAALLVQRYDLPVRLLLVGGETREPDPAATPEIGALQGLSAELGIGDRVLFTGKRQPEELSDYYCAGDVVVTTPWYEPFGLTPLEAMACGRPVIGSAVGGITHTVEDGVTGLLVSPRDPEALARGLQRLLRQPERRERMGRAARLRVERYFTWTTVGKRTAELYEELLSLRARDCIRGSAGVSAWGSQRADRLYSTNVWQRSAASKLRVHNGSSDPWH